MGATLTRSATKTALKNILFDAEKHIRALENSGVLSQFDHSILLESGVLRDVMEDTIRRHENGWPFRR